MMYVVWWVLTILLMIAGVVGAFVPAIPGIPLLYAGMLLGAWIDHFTRVGAITLAILGALTVLALAIDFAATVLGAKRAGASRLALIGSGVGTVVGLFFGLPGLLLGPFVGAVAGELMAQRSLEEAARVGIATWLGLLVAAIARCAILFTMIGIFVLTYVFNGPVHA